MKLLVYEFLSGGGLAQKPLPAGVLSEGFSMLRTLISDFKVAGHAIATVLDSRLATLNPPLEADIVTPVSSWETAQAALYESTGVADAAYIIAPESDSILRSLVRGLEDRGGTSLNCSSSCIGEVSNKLLFQKRAEQLGLHTPETITLNLNEDVREIAHSIEAEIGFPAVFKPADGVGCAGLSLVYEEAEVAGAVRQITRETSSDTFLAQEFVQGEPSSVSVISTGKEALPLSLNKQTISLATPESFLSYEGGVVPFNHPLAEETLASAKRVVESYDGLVGYVGVDFVLTSEKPVILELNPRATTSYVGLHSVVGFNVAQAILNAVLDHRLPEKTQKTGFAYFSKVWTARPTRRTFREACNVHGLVSPPFPMPKNKCACALLTATGVTVGEARMKFEEERKQLFRILTAGGK